jgi:transposase
MNITLIGLDLAKNTIQVCGVNQAGKSVFNRALPRTKLLQFLAQYPEVPIAMEACSGSNYWGRTLEALGHKTLLIPPQHVKPFVKGNKNDRNDAFAICEAARRPNLRFVRPRSLEQVDMLWAHRQRERIVRQRTQLINQMRGMLHEYGIVVPQGKGSLKTQIPWLLEDAKNGLTDAARYYLQEAFEEWQLLDARVASLDRDIAKQCKASEAAVRLSGIRGVGQMTATAIVAFAGNATQYQSARHFSANLGLVPKEHSSGGKQRLGGITKRGNVYIRNLLIQGGWSIISHINKSNDRLTRWARQLIERRGKQRAAVAIANKLARIIWALLSRGGVYQP